MEFEKDMEARYGSNSSKLTKVNELVSKRTRRDVSYEKTLKSSNFSEPSDSIDLPNSSDSSGFSKEIDLKQRQISDKTK
jgi:hypothetical protein